MKTLYAFLFLILAFSSASGQNQEIHTLFGRSGRSTGGYIAFSNKFTTLGDSYANIPEIYGGAFINRNLMVGFGIAASTNDIRVPIQYSVWPTRPMTYQYGQGGLKLEYVIGSNQAVHLVLNAFGGVGFTAQYDRRNWEDYDWDNYPSDTHDSNWFYVFEPGAQLEMNLFRWLRLSPGVSYRKTYGSDARGLNDTALSDWSYNVTLKIGNFGKNKVKVKNKMKNKDRYHSTWSDDEQN